MKRTLGLAATSLALVAAVGGLYLFTTSRVRKNGGASGGGTGAVPQPVVDAKGRPLAWAQPIEKPGLPNFHKVSGDLYRGAQPTEAGMKELRQLGIKTVINLRFFHGESDDVEEAGMEYVRMHFNPWHPEEKEVLGFLRTVTDKNRAPVFVHCKHGADRTGMMCAFYRIVVQGWSKEDAIEEYTKGGFGFHEDFFQNLVEYIKIKDQQRLRNEVGR